MVASIGDASELGGGTTRHDAALSAETATFTLLAQGNLLISGFEGAKETARA